MRTATDGQVLGADAAWRDARFPGGELATPAELVQLLLAPLYYGVGVPRGNGAPVLALPGFLGNDLYLAPLRGWLRRIGYQPYESTLLLNAGDMRLLTRRLVARTAWIAAEHGCRVTLVGHSLGGLLARAVAAARPDLVAQIVALGSPLAAGMPGFAAPLPAGIPFTSIYTRADGVVHWRHCLDRVAANNIEVSGTHCGLVFNQEVYRRLGLLLAMHPAAPVQPAF